ncbi:hypothetical protein AD997_12100 [Erwinia amylovora]|nr:hypothetical protein AD997_12100 [Erwinia amylovora]RUT15139.1 hypothetical protein BEI72_12620 [Erwinia amylovora]
MNIGWAKLRGGLINSLLINYITRHQQGIERKLNQLKKQILSVYLYYPCKLMLCLLFNFWMII